MDRIEAFIRSFERTGETPDRYAGEYLIRALAALKNNDCELGETELRKAERPPELRSPQDVASLPRYQQRTTAEHRGNFERIKAGQTQ